MTLLKAAKQAQKDGKSRLLILGRADEGHRIEVHETHSGVDFGAVHITTPSHSSILDVVEVDGQTPPTGLENQAWRLLDANAVIAALEPLYGEP